MPAQTNPELSTQWSTLVGTLVVAILVAFFFLVLMLRQRRVLRRRAEWQRLETEKQQALTRAVLETQEAERRRLAVALHDGVGQVLSAVKMNLSRLEKQHAQVSFPDPTYLGMFASTQEMVNDSIGEIRTLIRDILPPVLRNFGLVEAVRDLCGKIQQNTGIAVQFSYDGEPFRAKPESEVVLYRVVQELFTNALQHAKATELTVSLIRRGEVLTLHFADNGVGFDPRAATNGLGLRGMEGRIQLLKGEIFVDSQPGQGTRTTLRVEMESN